MWMTMQRENVLPVGKDLLVDNIQDHGYKHEFLKYNYLMQE